MARKSSRKWGTPGTGLTLERGTVIGLNIRMNKMGGLPDYAGDNDPLVGEWASLMELLSFLGLSLAGSEK